MREELERLEKKILLDFYEKNDNPQIEVLTDYERIWAKYFDRKTLLSEGEAIDDKFNYMKTNVYFEEKTQTFDWCGEDVHFNMMYHFLSKDFQSLIDRNKEIGIDVKITVGSFKFSQYDCHYRHREGQLLTNIFTIYKMERV